MGTWGNGVMQNDTAADFEVFWKTYVVSGMKRDPEFWTPEQVSDFIYHARFRSQIAFGEQEIRAELLAAGQLYKKAGLPLGQRLFSAVEKAASLELRSDELKQYASPAARKRALLKFLESMGMQEHLAIGSVTEAASRDSLRIEVEKWIPFSARYREWIDISRQPFSHKPFFDLVPQWFHGLDVVMGRGLRNNDPSLENQGKKYRLMCLAFYVGFVLRLPDDERLSLIEKVEREWEEMYILPMPP